MDKKSLVCANWKMNLTHIEAISYARKIIELLNEGPVSSEISIHPPFTSIRSVQSVFDDSNANISLGAQNCHYEPSGAYTGEVSISMLKGLGVKFIIVGHSERRRYFCESDEVVNKKLRAIIEAELVPILCVGEDLNIREEKKHFDFVRNQIKLALESLKRGALSQLVVAYEPVWAIGTGIAASELDAQDMSALIREEIKAAKVLREPDSLRILYGGSVNRKNAKSFFDKPDIDGALVGGASLDAVEFFEIAKQAHI